MELANLIWHLGAALAALWAALSYRALSVRQTELRHAVLASLLPEESFEERPTPKQGRQRSLRTRALRWVVQECQRNHGRHFELVGQNDVLGLDQVQWSVALGKLIRFSERPQNFSTQGQLSLKWSSSARDKDESEGVWQWDVL